MRTREKIEELEAEIRKLKEKIEQLEKKAAEAPAAEKPAKTRKK